MHHRAYQQQDAQRRGTAAARGYDGEWRAVRDAYAREHQLCEDCLDHGVLRQLDVVDHKIPLPHGPRLDKRNLRSLCRPCHKIKSDKDKAMGYEANRAPKQKPTPVRWLVR